MKPQISGGVARAADVSRRGCVGGRAVGEDDVVGVLKEFATKLVHERPADLAAGEDEAGGAR
jgi:hypothetical protein